MTETVVNARHNAVTIQPSCEMWLGAGNIGPLGLPTNTIGFNNSAGATSTWILHAYNAATNTWTASTQTFDGFLGL